MGREDVESSAHDFSISDMPKSSEPTHSIVEAMQAAIMNRKPGDMVQFIVDRGITEVPPEFVKLPHERLSSTTRSRHLSNESPGGGGGPEQQIPLIDMSLLDDDGKKESVLAEIARACEEWGCFQLINHGVSGPVMDGAMEATQRFFALTAEEREEVRMTTVGGMGYGRSFDRAGVARDWIDRLTLTDFNKPRSGKEQESRFGNHFDLVLTKPPGAQEALDCYGVAVDSLSHRLLDVFSECLGQAPTFLSSKMQTTGSAVLNHYPPCLQPELVMGLAAHEDGGLFTLLHQSDVVGLEVLSPDEDCWVRVMPIQHAFVIIIADIMQVVSNRRFKSVSHRAFVGPITCTVIGNFIQPNTDLIVQLVPELCSKSNPPIYKSIPYSNHIKLVFNQGLKLKRLKVLEIDNKIVQSFGD